MLKHIYAEPNVSRKAMAGCRLVDFDGTRKQIQADQVRRKRVIEYYNAEITHWLASSMRFTSSVQCGVYCIQQIPIQT